MRLVMNRVETLYTQLRSELKAHFEKQGRNVIKERKRLCEEKQLHYNTVYKFEQGGAISVGTLTLICAWIDEQK